MTTYFLYVLRCNDDSLYAGIATDVERRVCEHNTSAKGAKYTATRRPVSAIYKEAHPDRSSALIAEAAFKKLSRPAKVAYIQQNLSRE